MEKSKRAYAEFVRAADNIQAGAYDLTLIRLARQFSDAPPAIQMAWELAINEACSRGNKHGVKVFGDALRRWKDPSTKRSLAKFLNMSEEEINQYCNGFEMD